MLALVFMGPLVRAGSSAVAGEYRCNAGFACIDLSLRSDGTFSAVWKADIGDVGSATGKWKQDAKEVRLVPSTATGPCRGYFTVLLESDCEGRPALIRREDLSQQGSRLFSFFKKTGAVNQPPAGTSEIAPSSSTESKARTLDDEITTHGPRYIIEYDGYNKERRRQERMLTWYRKGVGTHIVQAYKASDRWIVFQVNDEKEGSKW